LVLEMTFAGRARRRISQPRVQQSALIAATVFVFWNGLFGGFPRADQLAYLHQISELRSYGDILAAAPAWNRTHSAGDFILYRPVLYWLLGTEYYLFGYEFWLYQLTSLAIHIVVVIGVHLVLQRGALARTIWPFLLSLLLATSYFGSEIVLWQHIVGYILFAALYVFLLLCLMAYAQTSRKESLWCAIPLALLANLTYESGMVAASLIAMIFAVRIAIARVGWGAKTLGLPVAPREPWIAFAFALTVIIPVLASSIDLSLRGLHVERSEGLSVERLPLAFMYAIQQLGYWFTGLVVPTVFVTAAASRAHIVDYVLTPSSVTVLNVVAVAAVVVGAPMTLRRSLRRQPAVMWWLCLAVLLFLFTYSLVIAVGRSVVAASLLETLEQNIYYAYMPFVILATGIGLIAFAWREDSQQLPTRPLDRWIGHGLGSRILAGGVVGLIVANSIEVMDLAGRYRYVYSAMRTDLAESLEEWHRKIGDQPGVFYTVGPHCIGNDELPWFPGHYRRGSGWTGVPSTADVLYPARSYRLNRDRIDPTSSIIETISCPSHAAEWDLTGEWEISGKPTFIKRVDKQLTVVNEKSESASALIRGGEVVVPAWSITGIVTADGRVIGWSNGTTWRRAGTDRRWTAPLR
jgi:hypothetical protein